MSNLTFKDFQNYMRNRPALTEASRIAPGKGEETALTIVAAIWVPIPAERALALFREENGTLRGTIYRNLSNKTPREWLVDIGLKGRRIDEALAWRRQVTIIGMGKELEVHASNFILPPPPR